MTQMIEKVIAGLARARLEIDPLQLSEILWLAQHLPATNLSARKVPQPAVDPLAVESTPLAVPSGKSGAEQPLVKERRAANGDGRSIGGGVDLGLYIASRSLPKDRPLVPASAIRVPAATPLPAALQVGRALKPLKRRYASRVSFVFDDEATVQRFGESGLLSPVMRPARERWFDLALVVDDHASMAVWKPTVAEFYRLLIRHGAFRDVRQWQLAVKDERILLARRSGVVVETTELFDPSGRRIVLVVSDCVSGTWYRAEVWQRVAEWARRMPVALVQPLPERLWSQTGLGEVTHSVRSANPGAANAMLEVQRPWWDESEGPAVPLPVITLEPHAMMAWANLAIGANGPRVPAVMVPPETAKELPQGGVGNPDLEAKERIRRYRESASTLAFRLATYLSGVPLSLPVMRLVQYAMLPASSQVHLAEFLLGGLIEVSDETSVNAAPDEILYEFHRDVRDELQGYLLRGEALRILEAVSGFLDREFGQPFDFEALIADAKGQRSLPAGARPFAEMGRQMLRRIGTVKELRQMSGRASSLPAEATRGHFTPAVWILVVGTGRGALPAAAAFACKVLGPDLARRGYGLLSGGWPGVDRLVAEEFVSERRRLGGDVDGALVQVLEPRQVADFPGGTKEYVPRRGTSGRQAVERADAVVLIGGLGGTYDAYVWAVKYRKPVFPLASTGRDAKRAFGQMVKEGALAREDALGLPIRSRDEAQFVIGVVMERIRVALGLGSGSDATQMGPRVTFISHPSEDPKAVEALKLVDILRQVLRQRLRGQQSATTAEATEGQATHLSADNPWPGFDSFSEADRDFFYGRRIEIEALLRMVVRDRVAVIVGRPGVGKTSLLRAGLFPRLRATGITPIYIHLDWSDGHPGLEEQIVRAAGLNATIASGGLHLASLKPSQVSAGQAQSLRLQVSGTGFSSTCKVAIGDTSPRIPANSTATLLEVTLTPDELKTVGDLAVLVIKDGQWSNSLVLKVTAPTATDPAATDPPAADAEQIDATLSVAADLSLLANRREPFSTFSEYLRAEWARNTTKATALLVFDQFEEMFAVGRNGASEAMLDALATLIDKGDSAKALFCTRVDYLPDLDKSLRGRFPSITSPPFTLLPLDGEEALKVVIAGDTAPVDHKVAEQIVRSVAAMNRVVAPPSQLHSDVPLAQLEVDPALLSVTCVLLNRMRRERGAKQITSELVAGSAAQVLGDYYGRMVADLVPEVRAFLEDRMIAASGLATTVAWEEALSVPGVTAEALMTLIERNLLRRNSGVESRLSLTHEVLAVAIREGRDRRAAAPGRFRYDAYISYAHVDNAEGWVDQFSARLQDRLGQLTGGRSRIWSDNSGIDPTYFMAFALSTSATFICLISPAYLKSEFCRQELDFFLKGSTPGENRLFPVLKYPVSTEEFPAALRDLLQYRFFDEDPSTMRPRELSFDHESEQLFEVLNGLAYDLSRVLKRMKAREA
jgi:predicted Rossmann-fold nucleotide-binding protein